jgi:hypothetical protein
MDTGISFGGSGAVFRVWSTEKGKVNTGGRVPYKGKKNKGKQKN